MAGELLAAGFGGALCIGAAVLVGLGAVALIYNRLVTLRNRVKNAWAKIDVQLKRRYDLIPNLVETVKGYAKHEKTTLENITKARAGLMSGNINERAAANNMLSQALKSLFAVAENYPQLKANENFKLLQEELAGTENKIAYIRTAYNDSVLQYNTAIQKVPTNLVAGVLGFKEESYFEVTEAERAAPKVKFE